MKKFISIVTIVIFIFSSSYVGFAQQDSTVEKLLEEGKKAYVNGDFKEAINKLSLAITIIKNKKDLIDAYLTLSLTYFTIGENNKAEENILKILKIKPTLSLNPDIYSPKFIIFVEEIKSKNMVGIEVNLKEKAKLYIDDLFYGEGKKFNLKLVKGKHTIKVEKEGYKNLEQNIVVSDGSRNFSFSLEKLVPIGEEGIKKPNKEKTKPVMKKETKTETKEEIKPKEKKEPAKKEEGKIVTEKKEKKGGSKFIYYLGGALAGGIIAALLLSKKSAPTGPTVLKITSDPDGADVFIDGRSTGKITPCEITGIQSGRHELLIVKELYGQAKKEINIIEGETNSVYARLSPFKYEFIRKWGKNGTAPNQFLSPIGISLFNSDKRVLVEDAGNHVAKVFSTKGVFIRKIPVGQELLTPVDGLLLNSGETFIVDIGADGFFKLDSNGRISLFKGGSGKENGKFDNPIGIAIGPNNKLYIVDAGNYRIQIFNTGGGFVGKWGSRGNGDSQFQYPFGIAINRDKKRAYVSDVVLNKIVAFDLSGNYKFKWGSAGSGDNDFDAPTGLAVDRTGNVYVVDTDNSRIAKFTENGKFIINIAKGKGTENGKFNVPYGVAVAEDGTVYVADTGNTRIQVFKLSEETVSQGEVKVSVTSNHNGYHYYKGNKYKRNEPNLKSRSFHLGRNNFKKEDRKK